MCGEDMTQLIDDVSNNGVLIDETNKFELSISLSSTLIIDIPSYVLEDDLSQ